MSTCSPACLILKVGITVLLAILSIAALVGVFQTHVVDMGEELGWTMQFGSTAGSLAIIAFVASVLGFFKQMMVCMSKCEVCSQK